MGYILLGKGREPIIEGASTYSWKEVESGLLSLPINIAVLSRLVVAHELGAATR